MGKQIRRTITITLTETWTFAWAKMDDARTPISTVVQTTPPPKEEPDATLPIPMNRVDPTAPNAGDPSTPLLTPDSMLEAQSDNGVTKATANRKGALGRRRAKKRQSD